MRGLELPINVLVIVAIAIIVLIALIAMFYPAFLGGSSVATSEGARSAACQILVEGKKCNVNTNTVTLSDFDADKDGSKDGGSTWPGWAAASFPSCTKSDAVGTWGDNLASLCYCYYSAQTETACKKLCGC